MTTEPQPAGLDDPGWPAMVEAVVTGMADWHTAHPTATFAEIEAAVEAHLDELRARLLEAALVRAAAASPGTGTGGAGATCADCGGRLHQRGRHVRHVRVRGDTTVRLQRPYVTCADCGGGHFPPG